MSLKDDIQAVKQELSAEESFMESFFKIEKFYKKYKLTIISSVAVLIALIIGYYVSTYIQEQNTIAANKAFNTLLNDPKNSEAIATLKEKNPKLLAIAEFLQDNTKQTDVEFLKELSQYAKAIKENNIAGISEVSQNQNFMLKDFAIFNKALILTQEAKYKEAKETLKTIDAKSDIDVLAKMLEHFLLTK